MRRLFRLPIRRRIDREFDEELAFHLACRTEELMALGWGEDEARAEARRQFGDVDEARRYCRGAATRRENRRMRTEFLTELRHDLVFAFRTLRRAPGFAFVAALTLAVGIGANTAIFSVVRGVILRPLPFGDPDRIAMVLSEYKGRQFPYTSPANAADWQTRNRSFSALAVYAGNSAVLTGAGTPENIDGADVAADFFEVLRVGPVVGRLRFTEEEAAWQGPRVVILGETLWRTRFGADPELVGRSVTLDDETYRVVGVAPARSAYPADARYWMPFRQDPARLEDSRGAVFLGAVARLRDGVSFEAADADMHRIGNALAAEYPDMNQNLTAAAVPLHDWIIGNFDRPVLLLLGGVGFVLLIACANVASLLLVRGVARRNEIAVRAALGAGRGRLVRQLAAESALLAAAGGAAGLVLALAGTRLLVAAAPASIPRLESISVDGLVMAFTAGIAAVTGLLFGLLPARMLSRTDLAGTLRDGARGGSQGAGTGARRVLVVAEVALSVVLLAGAVLLIRSFDRLLRVDPGFRTAGITTFSLSLPAARYDGSAPRVAFMDQLLERLRAVPGVESAEAGLGLPLTGFRFNFSFAIRGRPAASPGEQPSAELRIATAGWFETMGIGVRRGRAFTAEDRAGGRQVLVLNEAAARHFFPGEDPIGQHLSFAWRGNGVESLDGEIVGVVADIRQVGLDREAVPMFWAPFHQWTVPTFKVVVRSGMAPAAVAAAARRVVGDLDPSLAVSQVTSIDRILAGSVAQPRFYMILLGTFAAVAMLLSAVGIYGVTAYLVGQRTREIGIRMALGASRRRVVRLVLREGAVLAGAGLLIGVGAALAVTRLLQALLFEVGTSDPVTYLMVAAVLGLAALAACWVPARRAARVDPALSMRGD